MKESRAIVSSIPGTTRDIIREDVSIDGFLFRLYDTAGIRVSDDELEKEGILRSREALTNADIVLFVMDAESVFELTDEERKKKAKKINLSLMGTIRSKSDPRFEELGVRLERLKEQYEAGVLSSLEWLKELLDAARDMVKLENETDEAVIADDKQALTEIFLEVKSDTTPQIIANVVEDIDKIVKVTRFDGWQNTHAGEREIKKALRRTLFKYQLHQDQELFSRAYKYIEMYY